MSPVIKPWFSPPAVGQLLSAVNPDCVQHPRHCLGDTSAQCQLGSVSSNFDMSGHARVTIDGGRAEGGGVGGSFFFGGDCDYVGIADYVVWDLLILFFFFHAV